MSVQNLPTPEDKNLQRVSYAIKQIAQGRSNATGTVTLTANAATTTVTNVNCSSESGVWFTAKTANAAAEIGNGTMYLSAVANGSFTVTHANNAQTDRIFYYGIQG